MNMVRKRLCVFIAAGLLIAAGAYAQRQPVRSSKESGVKGLISGPSGPVNEAIAAGATTTVTLQPVPPKTDPPSDYPPDSAIVGQTLNLSLVPHRVWFEIHITGWAPEILRTYQFRVDATDMGMDGGGYWGANADCAGKPVVGAGDIINAVQPCAGTCSDDGRVCLGFGTCRRCAGGQNAGLPCTGGDCPGSNCSVPPGVSCVGHNISCRAHMSGLTGPCILGEPSVCNNGFCSWGFQDGCHPSWIGSGQSGPFACDLTTANLRCGRTSNAPSGVSVPDHFPSYAGTLVVDVPDSAKGAYRIDFFDADTFLQNENPPPNNFIPIAELRSGTISIPCCNCVNSGECDDGNACTVDTCINGCNCTHSPIAGWIPQSECCDPANGNQGLIPPTTSCRTGSCSLGGSLGVPVSTNHPDGTACNPNNPCATIGQCQTGVCQTQVYAGPTCPKPRFISFEPQSDSAPHAYRIRLVLLHQPDPPYSGDTAADFSAFEGEYRWVGTPGAYTESAANPAVVHAAYTSCDPVYFDGSLIDMLHVTGAEVVPSSVYEVQSIAEGLDIGNESNYSAPLEIRTSRWGDVVVPFNPPDATTQPNQTDHAVLVDKFRGLLTAPTKPRALLTGQGAGGIPVLHVDISFAEVAASVDGFRGKGYPYAGPQPCP